MTNKEIVNTFSTPIVLLDDLGVLFAITNIVLFDDLGVWFAIFVG